MKNDSASGPLKSQMHPSLLPLPQKFICFHRFRFHIPALVGLSYHLLEYRSSVRHIILALHL